MFQHAEELVAAVFALNAGTLRLATSVYFLGACILVAGVGLSLALLRFAAVVRGTRSAE